MSTEATSPAWAEALLRDVFAATDGDSVTGDLLEEYRESIHPVREPWRADVWYITQVLRFVWGDARLWGTLFGAAFVGRTALDCLMPTTNFHVRASVSTYAGIAVLLTSAFLAARRSGSSAAGTIAGVATAAIGAAVSIAGTAASLAIWILLRTTPMSRPVVALRGEGWGPVRDSGPGARRKSRQLSAAS